MPMVILVSPLSYIMELLEETDWIVIDFLQIIDNWKDLLSSKYREIDMYVAGGKEGG